MRITNKCIKIDYTYSINSAPLEWVDTFRYFGVRFNRKLTWSDHVSCRGQNESNPLVESTEKIYAGM